MIYERKNCYASPGLPRWLSRQRYLLCKPDDRSSNLGTHVKVEQRTDSTKLSSHLYMHAVAHVLTHAHHTHTHTHTHIHTHTHTYTHIPIINKHLKNEMEIFHVRQRKSKLEILWRIKARMWSLDKSDFFIFHLNLLLTTKTFLGDGIRGQLAIGPFHQ